MTLLKLELGGSVVHASEPVDTGTLCHVLHVRTSVTNICMWHRLTSAANNNWSTQFRRDFRFTLIQYQYPGCHRDVTAITPVNNCIMCLITCYPCKHVFFYVSILVFLLSTTLRTYCYLTKLRKAISRSHLVLFTLAKTTLKILYVVIECQIRRFTNTLTVTCIILLHIRWYMCWNHLPIRYLSHQVVTYLWRRCRSRTARILLLL